MKKYFHLKRYASFPFPLQSVPECMYIFFAFTNSTVVISYEITTYKLWHFNFRYLKITPLNFSKNIFFKCFLFSCIIFLLISFFHMYMVYSLFFRFHDFCKSFTCFCWLQIRITFDIVIACPVVHWAEWALMSAYLLKYMYVWSTDMYR